MALKPKTKVVDFHYEPPELKNPDMTAVFDLDYILWAASSVGEKRTIEVTHLKSGKVKEFANRTEFIGRSKKKIGGWLGKQNEERESKGLEPFTLDDFSIEDKQEVENIENLLHTAKMMVQSGLDALGTSNAKYFIGTGDSFRLGLSTLLEYKSNRKETLKPLAFDNVRDYLIKKYKPTIVSNIECDDAVVMECYNKPDHVIIGVDKDYRSQPVKFIDINSPEEGIINGDCFGKLWIKDNGSVKGYGRLFFLFQCLAGDSSDVYKASCMSHKNLGDKGVYDILSVCQNDSEAIEATLSTFKMLYPEPKEVIGWRGNIFTIDWYYVLKEQFSMARMLRYNNDFLSWEDWCNLYV